MSGENYFADSSFLIDLASENRKALEIRRNADFISSSILCVYELAKLARFDTETIMENRIENLEKGDVEKAAEIYRNLRNKGEMVNQMDILIAAQAIKRDLAVLTVDKDFKKIEDVKTVYYRS